MSAYIIPAQHDRAEVRCESRDEAIRTARGLVDEGYPATVRSDDGLVWAEWMDRDDD